MITEQEKSNCGCQSDGLAIYPVRYTAVPTYINRPKPSWANLEGVTDIPLNDDYQYHIRRIKEGFIYVYSPLFLYVDKQSATIDDLDQSWTIYKVDDQGRLKKLSNLHQAQNSYNQSMDYRCPTLEKYPNIVSFITIPDAKYHEKVYIAYSELAWTEELLLECTKEPLPRMQEINIKQWLSQQQHSSATIATEQSLKQILDYDFEFIEQKLLPDNQRGNGIYPEIYETEQQRKDKAIFYKEITKINTNSSYPHPYYNPYPYSDSSQTIGYTTKHSLKYIFRKDNLKLNSTHQYWLPFKRTPIMVAPGTDTRKIFLEEYQNNLHTLLKNMKSYSAQDGAPMILAIEDALGVAQDLNEYYNDIYGHFGQFQREAEMELDVKKCMVKIRSYVASKVAQKDYDFAAYKDEYYQLIDKKINIDDHDYQKTIYNQRFKKMQPLGAYYASITPRKINTKEQLAQLKSPIKRQFYEMVHSYIILVKDYFYGKPFGHRYYQKFMNYLKFNRYKADDYYIANHYRLNDYEKRDYYPDSIYGKLIKYSSFVVDASPEETKQTTLILHDVYQELVKDYETNQEELKKEFDQQVDKALEKYTQRLDSKDFDVILNELNSEVDRIANERAKQLIRWLEQSHYLTTINDLSYENKIEIDGKDELWKKYKTQLDEDIEEALKHKEITEDELEHFNSFNINGFYFQAIYARTTHGLENCETGRQFSQKMSDPEILKDIDFKSDVYIKLRKTHFALIAFRALVYDFNDSMDMIKTIRNMVDQEKEKQYEHEAIKNITIKSLASFTLQVRKSSLIYEYIYELKKIQQKANLNYITLDTRYGKNFFVTRFISNYNSAGMTQSFYLWMYDNLIKKCKAIGNGLFSMGAVIAEAAILSLAGVVWKTSTLYAHLKYELIEALTIFKSACFTGVDIGGGFKLISTAYSAEVKKLIKDIRDSLNQVIENIDKRFYKQLIEIEHVFKKTLNITMKIFPHTPRKEFTQKQLYASNARLAFLVGAFEVYNWQYVMDKKPNIFANDVDILTEQATATGSLIAAGADFTASACQALGKRSSVFVYSKLSFGVFTGIVSFISSGRMFRNICQEYELGNNASLFFAGVAGLLYLGSGTAFSLLGMSYKYAWVQTLLESKLPLIADKMARRFGSKGVQKAFNLFAMRAILFRFAGIFGLAAFVLELLYDYFADDEIQVWITYSSLGIRKGDLKFRMTFEQRAAFEQIEQLVDSIQQETGINLSKVDKKAIENIKQDYEDIILISQNNLLKWLI